MISGEAEADEDVELDNGRVFRRRNRDEELHDADARDETEQAADEANDGALDDDLHENIAAFRADRAPDADLADALGDAWRA